MNIRGIMAQRANEQFRQLLVDRGLSVNTFLKQAYGVDSRGKSKGSGVIYPVLKGDRAPNTHTLALWAEILKMPLQQLQELFNVKTSTGTALVPAAVPRKLEVTSDRVTLKVAPDGLTASLRIVMDNVPVGIAIAVMNAALPHKGEG